MASVSKQILVDTKTGQRGEGGIKACSWNQRCVDFTTFCKLEPIKGEKAKPVKVLFETSPNGKDWRTVHRLELKEDESVDFKDYVETHMLAHFRVCYDENALFKGQKEKTKVADLHAEINYRDVK